MRIGISTYDKTVDELVALSQAGEAAGFGSIWLGEHVMAPLSYGSTHPTQPGSESGAGSADHHGKPIVDLSVELVDPLIALAGVAAKTTTFGIATGIYLLPLRHPLLIARAGVTLHDLSGGRFRLGIGSGWLREEFTALGVDFSGRTGRLEEALVILRTAWAGGPFTHHGEHYEFDELQIATHPVEVPLILGGNTEPALRRAVRLGDGWFTSGIPELDVALRLRDQLASLQTQLGRTRPLQTTWRVTAPDPALIDKYSAEGFEEVLVMDHDVWTGEAIEERSANLRRIGSDLGLVPGGGGAR